MNLHVFVIMNHVLFLIQKPKFKDNKSIIIIFSQFLYKSIKNLLLTDIKYLLLKYDLRNVN